MSGIEILGLASSVVQIADVGLKLSVKLFTFTRKIKSADKGIDALSHEIAATGAVLQALGSTLSEKGCVQLCSPQAITTAKDLLSDCQDVFCRLGEIMDSPGAGQKGKVNLRQRFHFTFMESQIEELRANLERLKSSLLVIIQVLMLAEQLRNREALPLIRDTQQMLESLILENTANEKRYNAIVKLIEDRANDKVNPTRLPPAHISTIATPATTLQEHDIAMRHDLPEGLQYHRQRILDHGALVSSLLQEVSSARYKIDHTHRSGLHEGILNIHWDAWSNLRQKYGSQVFMKLLAEHEDVARHWADRKWSNIPSRPYTHEPTPQATVFSGLTPGHVVSRSGAYSESEEDRLLQSEQSVCIQQRFHPGRAASVQENKKDSTGPSLPPIPPSVLPDKPSMLRSACDCCRSAKTRCDGIKTGCKRCSECRLDCHYSESRVGKVVGKREKKPWLFTNPVHLDENELKGITGPSHALQDYQMQLMLLEQQNRKRLMMARQEQVERRVDSEIPSGERQASTEIARKTSTELLSSKSTNARPESGAMPPPDLCQNPIQQSTHPIPNETDEASFNVDFARIDDPDVLENFDFDAFLDPLDDQAEFDFCSLSPDPESRPLQEVSPNNSDPREGFPLQEHGEVVRDKPLRRFEADVPALLLRFSTLSEHEVSVLVHL